MISDKYKIRNTDLNIDCYITLHILCSSEEANALDPQVCLLLEVSWEGLEDAGIPGSVLRGTNTGKAFKQYLIFTLVSSEYNSTKFRSSMIAVLNTYSLYTADPEAHYLISGMQ